MNHKKNLYPKLYVIYSPMNNNNHTSIPVHQLDLYDLPRKYHFRMVDFQYYDN